MGSGGVRRWWIAGLVVIAALGACGGGEGNPSSQKPIGAPRPSTTATQAVDRDKEVAAAIKAIVTKARATEGNLFAESDAGEIASDTCPVVPPEIRGAVANVAGTSPAAMDLQNAEIHGRHATASAAVFCAFGPSDIVFNVAVFVPTTMTRTVWRQEVADGAALETETVAGGTASTVTQKGHGYWEPASADWGLAMFVDRDYLYASDIGHLASIIRTALVGDSPCKELVEADSTISTFLNDGLDPKPGSSPSPIELRAYLEAMTDAAKALRSATSGSLATAAATIQSAATEFDRFLTRYDDDIRAYTDTSGDSAIDDDVNAIIDKMDLEPIEDGAEAC